MSETKQEWRPGDRVVVFGTIADPPTDRDGDVLVNVGARRETWWFEPEAVHALDVRPGGVGAALIVATIADGDAARGEVERVTRERDKAVTERDKAVLERDAACAELESIRFILNGDAEGLSAKAAVDQFTGVAARVARDLAARTAERDEARAEVERLKRGEPVDLDAVIRADEERWERTKFEAERDAARAQRDATERLLARSYGTIAALREGGVSE